MALNKKPHHLDELELFDADWQELDTTPNLDWLPFLEDGETILWEGAPEISVTDKYRNIQITGIGGVMIGSGLFSVSQGFVDPNSETASSAWLAFGFLLTALGAAVIWFKRRLVTYFDPQTAYAISSRHALVVHRNANVWPMKFPLSHLGEIVHLKDDLDHVYFADYRLSRGRHDALKPLTVWKAQTEPVSFTGQLAPDQHNPPAPNYFGFQNLKDGTAPAELLQKAKRGHA